jgi:hypothetical protein
MKNKGEGHTCSLLVSIGNNKGIVSHPLPFIYDGRDTIFLTETGRTYLIEKYEIDVCGASFVALSIGQKSKGAILP